MAKMYVMLQEDLDLLILSAQAAKESIQKMEDSMSKSNVTLSNRIESKWRDSLDSSWKALNKMRRKADNAAARADQKAAEEEFYHSSEVSEQESGC